MQEQELLFVVPTYRLRDVGETIEQYDEHFWRNGHSVRMIVFDDSSPANQEKYYPLLEQTATYNDLYYVGPTQKEQFLLICFAACATRSWSRWSRTCSGPVTGAIATTR